MPVKVRDERLARLERVKSHSRFGTRQHFAQLHEAMATAAGVERIHRDPVTARGIERAAIGEAQVR